MSDLFPVDVECHSGYKADEYPVRFYCDNVKFEIREILDRWYQGDLNPDFPAANYFKVRAVNEKIYILKHEDVTDRWYLWIHGESISL
jgi:hypothetical protein